jgi:hypothetical protein
MLGYTMIAAAAVNTPFKPCVRYYQLIFESSRMFDGQRHGIGARLITDDSEGGENEAMRIEKRSNENEHTR